MEPTEFSRVIGQILGSFPFTMDDRNRILAAMGEADSIEEFPDDIKQLLNRSLPDYTKPQKEARASRLSNVERSIIKDSDKCSLCVANNDPRKVPVHPNCHCDVVTDSIEAGVADRGSIFFNPLIDDLIEVVDGELEPGQAIQLNPETAAILEAENARWADLEKWLTEMQPYLQSGEQYITIVVDDETEEAISEFEEAVQIIAEDSEQVREALTNNKLWFAIGKAVVL